MSESYKIGSTDLASVMTHLQRVDGNIGVAPVLQDDYVVPGRTGVVAATPWFGPRVITFGGVVAGATRAAYQTSLKELGELVLNGGDTFTLSRTLITAGTPTHRATARYLGGLEQVEALSNRAGRVAFDVQLMDGFFYDSGFTSLGTVTGTATVTVDGEAPTQNVTITYSVGAGSQRINNNAFPGLGRLTLKPGNNTLVLTGGGNVVLSYKAAWL